MERPWWPLIGVLCCMAPVSAGDKAPPRVSVARPILVELSQFDFLGRLEPVDAVEVRPEVSGDVLKVKVRAGDTVKKGDLLIELDPTPSRKQIDAVRLELKEKEEALKLQEEKLAAADKDKKTTEAERKLLVARQALAALQVKLAREGIAFLEGQLRGLEIRAPVAGLVDRLTVKEGDGVGMFAGAVCRIVNTAAVHVVFKIDEEALMQLRELAGDTLGESKVQMGLADKKDSAKLFPFEGRIASVDTRADPVTGLTTVWALFKNTEGGLTEALLRSTPARMNARVRLAPAKPRTALLVPAGAIGTDGKGNRSVLIVDAKDRVKQRVVKTGQPYGLYQVIEAGLTSDDWVIVHGAGARVDPMTKALSPEDFVEDLRLPFRPGTLVAPLKVTLPLP